MRLTVYPKILDTLRSLAPPKVTPARYALKDFDFPLEKWNSAEKTMVLYGAPGVGKTTLCQAILTTGLTFRHPEKMRTAKYPNSHYGLIYDEGNISHLHIEAQIAWVDRYNDTQIHVRYGIVEIPAGHPLIITTNKLPEQIMALHLPQIARRVTCVLMRSPTEYEFTDPMDRINTVSAYAPSYYPLVRQQLELE